MKHRLSASRHRAFTLVELLIVIAIIGLLMAILFPVFKTAQEKGYQASCASNLQQIGQAVQMYRADNKYYPGSLAAILPSDYELDGGTNTDGTGDFKGGRDTLVCADDDSDASTVRSSYGDISFTGPPASSLDMSRYLWNYWGYRKANDTDAAKCGSASVSGCAGTAFSTSTEADAAAVAAAAETPAVNIKTSPDIAVAYNARTNPIKYSLSNRFAPTGTIITHCVYHRLPTAKGRLAAPYEIYDPTYAADATGARDIVLRLDGSAKLLDVSKFTDTAKPYWQKQNF